MNKGNSRRPAETEIQSAELSLKEHARVIVVGVLASAVLAGIMFATAAQGGSGGLSAPSSGDGGGKTAINKRYAKIYRDFPRRAKRWARSTSECESGGNAKIHGGGGRYHGAFQFLRSTWKSAPKSVGNDPHKFAWKTQAVVAVKLKRRDGAGHWPVCG